MVVVTNASISFTYDGRRFENGFRADLVINRCLVVEIKSVELLAPVHAKPLLTYLRLMQLPLGLLINFGGAYFKDNIRRVVNGLAEREATQAQTMAAVSVADVKSSFARKGAKTPSRP